jgi:aspartate carbamoyltransferase catalytic subunit
MKLFMDTLITEIDTFTALHGINERDFGLQALNDKNFVPQLRAGRDLRMSTVVKVRDFMAAYQPQSAAA